MRGRFLAVARGAPNNRFERSRVASPVSQGKSLIGINQLRWALAHSRVAQPHR